MKLREATDSDHYLTSDQRIKDEYKQWKKSSPKSIKDELNRTNKIIDLRDLNKEDMIFMILRDKYGDKKINRVFGF